MFKVKETEAQLKPAKKTLELKNISVKNLKLVDNETGEDITEQVIAEIPEGIEEIDFKLNFELADDNE